MKRLMSVLLLAGVAFAGGIPSNNIYGEYVEARTADVFTGPCFANAEVGLVGDLAVFGWKVTKGSWHGTSLDGLGVVAAVRATSTLGDIHHPVNPVSAVLILDERATPEQRLALQSFARKMSGDLLKDVVRVETSPINLTFANNDMHSMKATLSAGSLAKIETRAIHETDHLCRNEEIWYQPFSKTNHFMPAVATAHRFNGRGLGTTWSNPNKRSSFIGSFVETAE